MSRLRRAHRGFIHLDGIFSALIVVGIVIGAFLATLVWIVFPWAWELIRPILHAWTAA